MYDLFWYSIYEHDTIKDIDATRFRSEEIKEHNPNNLIKETTEKQSFI